MYKLILVTLALSFVVWSAQNVKEDWVNVRANHNSQLERAIDSCR